MSRDLPENWVEVPLRELLLPTTTTKPTKGRSGTFRYIDINAVDNQRQVVGNAKTVACEAAPSRARREVRTGDVICSLVRPCLKNLAIIPQELDGEIASTAFYVCRPGAGIYPAWLYQHLRRDSVINELPTVGNSPPSTRDTDFEDHQVRVAPSAEQKRILAELEPALAKIDEAQESLERVRKNLDRYRSSVLKAACEGRLVPNEAEMARQEGREFEPASVLLKRILIARREAWEKSQLEAYAKKDKKPPKNWKSRYREPVAPDTKGLPELPEGWCWASIDQLLIEEIRTGLSIKSDDRSNGVRSLRLDALHGPILDLSRFKILPIDEREVMNLVIKDGDFFVSRGNGSIDRLANGAVARGVETFTIFPDIMFRLRFAEEASGEFVKAIWSSKFVRAQVADGARSTSGVFKISKSNLQSFVLPIPPGTTCRAITEAISEIESKVLRTIGIVEARHSECRSLRQSLLKRAFSGNLIPQEPNDEPAATLLERIRAQRLEQQKVATPARKRVVRPRKSPTK